MPASETVSRKQVDEEVMNSLESYRRRVRLSQVERLIESSGFSNLVGFIMASLWVGLVWNDLPREVLIVWLGVMSLLFGCCALIHYFRWYRIDSDKYSREVIRRWYLLALIFIGVGWGITSVLMFPYSQLEQIVLAFILIGVSATGVTYSHVAWVYIAYVGSVLAPLMVRLFLMGGEVYYSLSAMTGFFLGVMIMAAMRMNRASSDAQALSFRNEDLIGNLRGAHAELENLNNELTEEIDHVKRIEAELKLERDRAEKMSQAKGEFLANMSHEIRTPMNGVIGTLQLIEDTELDTEQRDYVSTAHKSADALLTILNDILDLSKIEAGKLNLEKIAFDLREIVTDLVTLYSLTAEKNSVEFLSEIDSDFPQAVMGDPTRMRQILANLVSNALKFTHEGEVKIRLQVLESSDEVASLRIEVADTGIGIPLDKQEKLFTAFTQADGSTTRKYGGTGLGLAIVRQLTEMMHADLNLESDVGKGARFWVDLELDIAKTPAASFGRQLSDEVIELSGTVLLVEDNPVNQMVAKKMLEKIGLKSILATNGIEALEKLEIETVDLVLMDCQMPEMDGFEATRQIRIKEQASGGEAMTVIAMTANVMEGDRELCLQAGMDDYIGKPVRKNELASTIARWIQEPAN